ncbi:hypothetical protein [uncultured Friedmanniella sp.]|uniref:hypothetical protein n=1 Tax=uncultured Friedmanniella sp. TaxID=335381 RepID=UPI0035CA4395
MAVCHENEAADCRRIAAEWRGDPSYPMRDRHLRYNIRCALEAEVRALFNRDKITVGQRDAALVLLPAWLGDDVVVLLTTSEAVLG